VPRAHAGDRADARATSQALRRTVRGAASIAARTPSVARGIRTGGSAVGRVRALSMVRPTPPEYLLKCSQVSSGRSIPVEVTGGKADAVASGHERPRDHPKAPHQQETWRTTMSRGSRSVSRAARRGSRTLARPPRDRIDRTDDSARICRFWRFCHGPAGVSGSDASTPDYATEATTAARRSLRFRAPLATGRHLLLLHCWSGVRIGVRNKRHGDGLPAGEDSA